MVSDLIRLTAREIRLMLKNGSISPLELLECLAERISAIDPTVNALPTLCFDRAFEAAKKQGLDFFANCSAKRVCFDYGWFRMLDRCVARLFA